MSKLNTQALTTLVLVLLCVTYSKAQYFSKRLNYNSENNFAGRFIVVNNTICISINMLDTHDAFLGRLTLNGDTIPTKRYGVATGTYFNNAPIVKMGNKLYLSGAGGFYNTIQSPFYKMNIQGDTLHTAFIGDTTYYALIQAIVPSTTHKDRMLFIGTTDSTCSIGHQGIYKPMIRVIDTNGVLLQTKLYTNNCRYTSVSIADTTENKGYILSGSELQTFTALYFIMKLDSNLNLVWKKYYNVTGRNVCGLVTSKRGGYILGHTVTDSIVNFSTTWERPSISKLNTNGTIKWHKEYGVKEYELSTTTIKECANGDILMAGGKQVLTSAYKGWIMRTDSLGNLKWWRWYHAITSPVQDVTSDNYIYDIQELSNGDIVGVGSTGGSNVVTPLQQTWILKTDRNGCLGANNCPPSIANGTNGVEELSEASTTVNVYPNPFNTNLNVSYAINEVNAGTVISIKLIDLVTGGVLAQTSSTKNVDVVQFNTDNLASGVYIVNISANNITVSNTKVINIK
jgi:hypothetical protein